MISFSARSPHEPGLRLVPTASHPGSCGLLTMTLTDVHLGAGLIRVHLGGELDVSTGPRLSASLERLLGPDPAPLGGMLVIDLSGLHFTDLSGLDALMASRSVLTARGWRVALVRPTHDVARLVAFAEAAEWRSPELLRIDETNGVSDLPPFAG
jgi:anti-sigma B factor antagonist